MGMYDTINGEQVKCFSWVSLYHGSIDYHGGDLKCYDTGDEVPYKRPHYNYGKNFIILDVNRFPESDLLQYDYVLHVIVDGKVKDTFVDEIGEIDWAINNLVVSYTGELLNIKSPDDVINFVSASRDYLNKTLEIRSHWSDLLSESMDCLHGIGLLDTDSEEKTHRIQKIDTLHELMDAEEKRIEPELEALWVEHSKWFVDTTDIDDLIELGAYISVYNSYLDEQEKCKEIIQKLLSSDDTLYDRYVKWQGTDRYIKRFEVLYE